MVKEIGFYNNWGINKLFNKTTLNDNILPMDNPFLGIGYTIGYDERFNRLLFTKKEYKILEAVKDLANFDGQFYTQKDTGEELIYNDFKLV